MPNHNEIYQRLPWYLRYPLAFGLFLLALLLRFNTLPLESGLAYVTFYPAVVIGFYLFGAGPGTLVAILSGLAGSYFFIPPYNAFANEFRPYSSLPYFFLSALLIGYVITKMHEHLRLQQGQRAKMERLQRIYAAVLEADKLISQKLEPASLFDEIVKIAVQYGGMKMAWVGIPDAASESIVPRASYGEGVEYVEGIFISMREEMAEGRGSTGTAFRERRTSLVQDFLNSARTRPWHDRARAYGWQSSASFPVFVDGKIHALLNVYGSEINAFDDETVALMEGLAADLGHALDEYNLAQARRQAEAQMEEARKLADTAKNRLEHLLKHAPAVMYSCRVSTDFGVTFISENIRELMGYEPNEVIEDSAFWLERVHPDDLPATLEGLKNALNGEFYRREYRFRRKDGVYRWMRDEAAIIRDRQGRPVEMIGYWGDITSARELEKILRLRQFSLDHADEQVYWIDSDARFIDISENARRKLGYSREESLNLTVGDVDATFPVEQWGEHWQELKTKGSLRFESIHKTKDGRTYPVEIIANFFEYDGREYNCALVRDITERKILEHKLMQQAHIDYLTGVSTRGHFMEQAELELSRAIRYQSALSIIMMDVDFVKRINDSHGHKTGDLVLKKLAEVCRQSLREVDVIGRMGGEEFAILLPETENDAAMDAAVRLKEAICAAKVPMEAGLPLQITVSIGLSSLASSEDNIDVLLNRADKALYQAKENGRNTIVGFQFTEG
ncbi:MAG: diguanylate cyclase [Methylomonas sp.]|nr:diguanylate cyclase [Methylomonas sp.]